jgi:hypothetical protein
MAFQMGGDGLAAFTHMLAAIKVGHWDLAETHMLNSKYAKQTPNRAQTNAQTLVTGAMAFRGHVMNPTWPMMILLQIGSRRPSCAAV